MDKNEERALAAAVGRAIAQKRVEAGMTQEVVAERLGLQREAVARVERGTAVPTVVRLIKLADLFGCQIDDLLVEGSTRTDDQAKMIVRLLDRVSLKDRQLLLGWLENFSERLRVS